MDEHYLRYLDESYLDSVHLDAYVDELEDHEYNPGDLAYYDGAPVSRDRNVPWNPFPSQTAFYNSVSRFTGFSGPVGTGKSSALVMRALQMAYINAGRAGVITAPTYRMLADTTRANFLETCVEKRIPYTFRAIDNAIYLQEPGSLVRFRSTDDPIKLVGSNLAWFAMDELTYTKQDAWNRLVARLRDPKARQLAGFAVWTPKGLDWVWRNFVSPKSVPGYETIFARPAENTAILDATPDYYERLRLSYEDAFYRQEALGEYISTGGSKPYSEFDATKDVEKVGFDPRYPIIWSLDFNLNPMCSVIAQKIPGNPDRLHILQELYLKNSNTRMALEQFIRRTRPYVQRRNPLEVEVVGDSTGRANDSTGEFQSDWDIIFNGFRQYPEYRAIRRIENNPSPRSRIIAVNSAFCNAAGIRRISMDESCIELARDMTECKWVEDKTGAQLPVIDSADKARGHLGDALGYLVWSILRIMQSVGPQSGR